MGESRLMQSMLLDFYGALLTDKQRECFDLHYNEDLSLAEIAEQCGISRQGVWDNIRRAEAALNEYEAKTGLVRRFNETQKVIGRIKTQLSALTGLEDRSAQRTVDAVLDEIKTLEG